MNPETQAPALALCLSPTAHLLSTFYLYMKQMGQLSQGPYPTNLTNSIILYEFYENSISLFYANTWHSMLNQNNVYRHMCVKQLTEISPDLSFMTLSYGGYEMPELLWK